jgi:Protein of unknown function (DUF2474)
MNMRKTDMHESKAATSQNLSRRSQQIKLPWWKKIGWLIMIWCGSVLALLAVSMLFRMMMTAAGMKSH